jgi:hypothetical protein
MDTDKQNSVSLDDLNDGMTTEEWTEWNPELEPATMVVVDVKDNGEGSMINFTITVNKD